MTGYGERVARVEAGRFGQDTNRVSLDQMEIVKARVRSLLQREVEQPIIDVVLKRLDGLVGKPWEQLPNVKAGHLGRNDEKGETIPERELTIVKRILAQIAHEMVPQRTTSV